MLTKFDIAALRKADRVVFAHWPKDGASHIRAIKDNRPTEKDPFARDVEITIACGFRLTDYSEGNAQITYDASQKGAFTAFEMIHCSHLSDTWQTIAELLREGDTLTLEWQRDARRCGHLTDAALHGDALDLRVERKNARLTFHVDTSISADNTARMVRVPWTSTRAAQTVAA